VYSLLNEMLKKDKTKNCSVMKAFPIVYQEPWQLKLPEFTEVPVLHEGNKPLRPVALRRFVREMRRNRAGIRKCPDHTQQ